MSILAPMREKIARGDKMGASRYVSDGLAETCYLLGDTVRCHERTREYEDAGVDSPLLLSRLEGFRGTVGLLGRSRVKRVGY